MQSSPGCDSGTQLTRVQPHEQGLWGAPGTPLEPSLLAWPQTQLGSEGPRWHRLSFGTMLCTITGRLGLPFLPRVRGPLLAGCQPPCDHGLSLGAAGLVRAAGGQEGRRTIGSLGCRATLRNHAGLCARPPRKGDAVATLHFTPAAFGWLLCSITTEAGNCGAEAGVAAAPSPGCQSDCG